MEDSYYLKELGGPSLGDHAKGPRPGSISSPYRDPVSAYRDPVSPYGDPVRDRLRGGVQHAGGDAAPPVVLGRRLAQLGEQHASIRGEPLAYGFQLGP